MPKVSGLPCAEPGLDAAPACRQVAQAAGSTSTFPAAPQFPGLSSVPLPSSLGERTGLTCPKGCAWRQRQLIASALLEDSLSPKEENQVFPEQCEAWAGAGSTGPQPVPASPWSPELGSDLDIEGPEAKACAGWRGRWQSAQGGWLKGVPQKGVLCEGV